MIFSLILFDELSDYTLIFNQCCQKYSDILLKLKMKKKCVEDITEVDVQTY